MDSFRALYIKDVKFMDYFWYTITQELFIIEPYDFYSLQ